MRQFPRSGPVLFFDWLWFRDARFRGLRFAAHHAVVVIQIGGGVGFSLNGR
jgi:hypothetical protein